MLAVAVLTVVAATMATSATVAYAQEFSVVVASDELNARTAPNTSAPVAETLSRGDVVPIYGQVAGEAVEGGNVVWFRTQSGYYIYSGSTRPLAGNAVSTEGMAGRWIEVDRSAQVIRAMDGGQVVYSAPVTVGVQAFATPTGVYAVERRVANETMDSATIGIPRDAPNGYYLTDVLYTQYFENGYALHYNYWSPPEVFGNSPASHGCIGMQLSDAEFFWNFAGIGTPVVINP